MNIFLWPIFKDNFIVSIIYDWRYKMFDVDILCSPCDWLNVCSCVLEVYMRSCTIVDSS